MKVWDVTDYGYKYLTETGTYMCCIIMDDYNAPDMHFGLQLEPTWPDEFPEDRTADWYRKWNLECPF